MITSAETFPAQGERCFYCHGTLEDPAVMWMGHHGNILLHPGCVVDLTIRLFRDVHEIQCREHSIMMPAPVGGRYGG